MKKILVVENENTMGNLINIRLSDHYEIKEDNIGLDAVEMVIDRQLRAVYVKGKVVDLTPKEFNLLKLFVTNPRRVFSRDALLYEVWGIKYRREKRTVDSHIKNIREKLRRSNLSFNPIKTVWGVGYRLDEPVKDLN